MSKEGEASKRGTGSQRRKGPAKEDDSWRRWERLVKGERLAMERLAMARLGKLRLAEERLQMERKLWLKAERFNKKVHWTPTRLRCEP